MKDIFRVRRINMSNICEVGIKKKENEGTDSPYLKK